MYGIVNKTIEDLVIANFGEEKWKAVLEKSGIQIDFFISNEPYDDAITYQLAGAISEVMDIPLSQVLSLLGEWWILKTTKEKYPGLLDLGGKEFKEFLINLPHFHNHIMLLYPKLTPPEFRISNLSENSLHLHYHSKRAGLKDFVYGLLIGLGKLFSTPVQAKLIADRDLGADHEIFEVSW
jgi:hypothetical protein